MLVGHLRRFLANYFIYKLYILFFDFIQDFDDAF